MRRARPTARPQAARASGGGTRPVAHHARNQHAIAAPHATSPGRLNSSAGIFHQQIPAATSATTSGTGRGPPAGGSSAPSGSASGGSIHATATQTSSPTTSATAPSRVSARCSSDADPATSAARPARPSHGASRRIPVVASVLLKVGMRSSRSRPKRNGRPEAGLSASTERVRPGRGPWRGTRPSACAGPAGRGRSWSRLRSRR